MNVARVVSNANADIAAQARNTPVVIAFRSMLPPVRP
jgi:hypothetical protein